VASLARKTVRDWLWLGRCRHSIGSRKDWLMVAVEMVAEMEAVMEADRGAKKLRVTKLDPLQFSHAETRSVSSSSHA
jgi:hypothetical protein